MADDKSRLLSYTNATRTYVAFSSEARICGIAHQHCPSFVRAFEGGVTDCGLYMGLRNPDGDLADKVLSVLEAKDPQGRVIPIEAKDLAPITDLKANVYWIYHFTKRQAEHCQVAIISVAKDPEYVALLPLHYYRKRGRMTDDSNGQVPIYSCLLRPRWLLHSVPAFPPELAPFILPINDLSQALENIYTYAIGHKNDW